MLLFSSSLLPLKGEKTVFGFPQNFIYPVQFSFFRVKTFFSDLFHNYIELVSVAKENQKLKQEKIHLEIKLLNYNELSYEIKRLRTLLHFSQSFSQEATEATEVIGSFRHFVSRGVRVSSGSSKGIKVGMPVVASSGVVGQIMRTSYGFSDVLLVSDSNFVMDILMERTRVRSLLKGGSNNKCILELHHQVDVKVGDTLITSGMLDIFPKGLPVGKVTQITYHSGDTIQTAEVELWVEIQSLEEAVIIKKIHPHREEIVSIMANSY